MRQMLAAMWNASAKIRAVLLRWIGQAKKLAARLDADTAGATFASLRLKHGLTQSALAEKTGLKQSYLSRIENNRCTLSNDTVDKLAAVFGIGSLDVRAAFDRQWDFVEGLKS